MPMLAPHAADDAVAALPGRSRIKLTIDGAVAGEPRGACARAGENAAGRIFRSRSLAVEHATGDVLARVGSADYFDAQRAGQVDMTAALRSPGSTLKPFIYGLGFEDGFIHPETLIEDRPVRYGAYAPENFDLTFQGTVPVRKALQMSLNVPARRGARPRRRRAVCGAAAPGRRRAGAAEGRGARTRHGARRRRRAAFRSGDALCRHRAARHHAAAEDFPRNQRCILLSPSSPLPLAGER